MKDKRKKIDTDKYGIVEVIKIKGNKVNVVLPSGKVLKNIHYESVKDGTFRRSTTKAYERMEERVINSQGVEAKIVGYRGIEDIDIEFEDGYIRKNVRYQQFKLGKAAHPSYEKGEYRKVKQVTGKNN